MVVKFLDTKSYAGWHQNFNFKKEEPVTAYGEKIHEDEEYLSLAQIVTEGNYANILRIPKAAIISVLLLVLLLIFWNSDIKGAIIAFLP